MKNYKRAKPEDIQEVSTNFYQRNESDYFKEPFNDATFFNYDPVKSLFINEWELPPAITIGVTAYPTFLAIELKVGCVNTTNFKVDTKGSATASWRVIYTQYLGIE